jgi:hypothetical protein
MDNYDNIAYDLKQTIDEYRQNLEYLKDRFADIGKIIIELDQLKLQAQHSELKGQDLFEKLSGLELKYADLSKQIAVLSADYDSSLTNLKNQHNEWSKAIDSIVRDVSASITDLRTDYNDRLNKAVAEISLQAKQEADSIEQYLQQFSKEQAAEIERIKQELVSNIIQSLGDSSTQLMNLNRELHNTSEDHREKVKSILIKKVEENVSLLEQKIESVEVLSAQKIEDLRNAVMLDIKTTRKTSIAGFIIILAFIIGLIVFLIVSL